jgi:hypothetical protein
MLHIIYGITEQQTQVDISQLSLGIFILKIEIDGKLFIDRVIIH